MAPALAQRHGLSLFNVHTTMTDFTDLAHADAIVLADLLRARGWKMCTAESCTGGMIAAACIDLAGSSDWFDRGWVTYSNTAKVEELIAELKDDYTVVIVTHNMQQAARISDRTAFFLLGELVECGPTSEIFSTPKDKRTEDYISGRFG